MSVTIPEQRQQAMDAAIEALQAQGHKVTNESVHMMTGIGWNTVKRHLQQWRMEQRVSPPPVAPAPDVVQQTDNLPTPPVPRPAPVPEIQRLRQLCSEDDEEWRRLEREMQQHQQDRAEHWSAFRGAMVEARRLHPLFLHALQASRLSVYRGNEQVESDYQRLRAQLAGLVGEPDVVWLETDAAYKPWWLTAER